MAQTGKTVRGNAQPAQKTESESQRERERERARERGFCMSRQPQLSCDENLNQHGQRHPCLRVDSDQPQGSPVSIDRQSGYGHLPSLQLSKHPAGAMSSRRGSPKSKSPKTASPVAAPSADPGQRPPSTGDQSSPINRKLSSSPDSAGAAVNVSSPPATEPLRDPASEPAEPTNTQIPYV